MPKPITFNIQRLIAAVAAEHSLILKPDDAAFAHRDHESSGARRIA